MSGLDVCRQLRSNGVDTPVIMLTARGQEIDKVIGLEMGADDYVTKPFSIKELLARVRAHLRRPPSTWPTSKLTRSEISSLKFKKYRSQKGGREIELSPREFELLKYFIQHRGETITRDQLLDDVWGYDNYPVHAHRR